MSREQDGISIIDAEEKGCVTGGCILTLTLILALLGTSVFYGCPVRIPFTNTGSEENKKSIKIPLIYTGNRLVSNVDFINSLPPLIIEPKVVV